MNTKPQSDLLEIELKQLNIFQLHRVLWWSFVSKQKFSMFCEHIREGMNGRIAYKKIKENGNPNRTSN
jgi:hypothetical protein